MNESVVGKVGRFQEFILDLSENLARQENHRLNLGITAVATAGLCEAQDAVDCGGCGVPITEYDWKQQAAIPLFFRMESQPDRLLVTLVHKTCFQKVQDGIAASGVKTQMQEGYYHVVDPTELN